LNERIIIWVFFSKWKACPNPNKTKKVAAIKASKGQPSIGFGSTNFRGQELEFEDNFEVEI